MSTPRNLPTTIGTLTPADELRVRHERLPAAIYGALLALDAALDAEGRHLPGMLVRWALRAEAQGLHAKALRDMSTAQAYRRHREPLQ